jgi:DNA-binding NarL/FixJ family response regulator
MVGARSRSTSTAVAFVPREPRPHRLGEAHGTRAGMLELRRVSFEVPAVGPRGSADSRHRGWRQTVRCRAGQRGSYGGWGDDEPGMRVILMTADAAAGGALAFSCARRGVDVIVSAVEPVVAADVKVVLVDLRSDAAASDLSGLRGEGVRRVIAIGEATPGTVYQNLDARVGVDASVDELIAAIIGTARTNSRPTAETTSELERLTPRERDVMALLLAGLRVEQIGAQLGIAANTVRTHLQNILAKLGVKSRAEAAAWALRAGLGPAEIVVEAPR